MTTLQEKLEKKIEEGFETIKGSIHMKVGESQMLCPLISVYHSDISARAKRLMNDVEELELEVQTFLAIKPAEPEKGPQLNLKVEVEVDASAPPKASEETPIDVEFTEAALPAHDWKAELHEQIKRVVPFGVSFVASLIGDNDISEERAVKVLSELKADAGIAATLEALGIAPPPDPPGRAPGEPAKRRSKKSAQEGAAA